MPQSLGPSPDSATPSVACIVLAAGGSRRMGEPKQLLAWGGRTLVRRAVDEALASTCRRTFVVLGARAGRLARELEGAPADLVVNAAWETGLASSVRAGIQAVRAAEESEGVHWEGVMLTLADQPDVSAAVLDALIDRYRGGDASTIVACAYRGVRGVPALFGRAYDEALSSLEGDRGAKPLLEEHRDRVLEVPFEGAARDIDTPEDYRALVARVPDASREER